MIMDVIDTFEDIKIGDYVMHKYSNGCMYIIYVTKIDKSVSITGNIIYGHKKHAILMTYFEDDINRFTSNDVFYKIDERELKVLLV